nr:MAG TPA: hypothetical protein [Caudoviricetes sp.]
MIGGRGTYPLPWPSFLAVLYKFSRAKFQKKEK